MGDDVAVVGEPLTFFLSRRCSKDGESNCTVCIRFLLMGVSVLSVNPSLLLLRAKSDVDDRFSLALLTCLSMLKMEGVLHCVVGVVVKG
jgi:hypothetical protein